MDQFMVWEMKQDGFAWKLCRQVSTARYVKTFGCCKGMQEGQTSLEFGIVVCDFFQQLRH